MTSNGAGHLKKGALYRCDFRVQANGKEQA
jgi:hypothetical protein